MTTPTKSILEYDLVPSSLGEIELYRYLYIKDISVDFDGTCVDNHYPHLGQTAPFAVETLLYLVASGRRIYLNTLRGSNIIRPAINWFMLNNIPLSGVQENPSQKRWTDSPKVSADLYIDDRGFGVPLIHPVGFIGPVVHWEVILDKFRKADAMEMPTIKNSHH